MNNIITHLTRLFIGDKLPSAKHSLTDGQFEVQNAAYFDSNVTIDGSTNINGALVLGSVVFGIDSFTGTSTSDVVTLDGVASTDIVLAFPYGSSITVNDVLSVATSGSGGAFTVYRPNTSGTSGLPYAYLVIRSA